MKCPFCSNEILDFSQECHHCKRVISAGNQELKNMEEPNLIKFENRDMSKSDIEINLQMLKDMNKSSESEDPIEAIAVIGTESGIYNEHGEKVEKKNVDGSEAISYDATVVYDDEVEDMHPQEEALANNITMADEGVEDVHPQEAIANDMTMVDDEVEDVHSQEDLSHDMTMVDDEVEDIHSREAIANDMTMVDDEVEDIHSQKDLSNDMTMVDDVEDVVGQSFSNDMTMVDDKEMLETKHSRDTAPSIIGSSDVFVGDTSCDTKASTAVETSSDRSASTSIETNSEDFLDNSGVATVDMDMSVNPTQEKTLTSETVSHTKDDDLSTRIKERVPVKTTKEDVIDKTEIKTRITGEPVPSFDTTLNSKESRTQNTRAQDFSTQADIADSQARTREISEDFIKNGIIKGTYRIQKELGKGGMGKVYTAEHIRLKKQVVIKTLLSTRKTSKAMKRFQREALLQAQVDHPNAVRIIDFDKTENNVSYIVMDLAPGKPLNEIIKDSKIPTLRAIYIIKQILKVMGYAHKKNIVHRDLKPHNIMIEESDDGDFVRVLDFGIAKLLESEQENPEDQLTKENTMLGSLYYMSPEQAGGEEVDFRCDLYSIGVILYEMLAGCLPLKHKQTATFIGMLLTKMPPLLNEVDPNLGIPRDLDDFIIKTLSKDANERYSNAQEMLIELERIEGILTEKVVKEKTPMWKILAIACFLSLLLITGFILTQPNKSQKYILEAKAFEKNKNWENAIVFYKKAFALNKDKKLQVTIMALSHKIEKQKKEKALTLKIQRLCDLGKNLEKKKMYKEAYHQYKKALALKKNKNIHALCLSLEKKIQEQRKEQSRRKKYLTLLKKLTSYIKKKKFADAKDELSSASLIAKGEEKIEVEEIKAQLEKKILARDYLAWAKKSYEMNLFKKALKECERALSHDKTMKEAYLLMGRIYATNERFDKALKNVYRALKIDKKYTQALNVAAAIYVAKKEPNKAEAYYKKTIQSNVMFAGGYNGLGVIYLARKEYEKAIETLKKAIELDSSMNNAKKNLAIALKRTKKYRAALAIYEDLEKVFVDDPDIPYNMAIIYLNKLKDYRNAYRCCIRYIELEKRPEKRRMVSKIKRIVKKLKRKIR